MTLQYQSNILHKCVSPFNAERLSSEKLGFSDGNRRLQGSSSSCSSCTGFLCVLRDQEKGSTRKVLLSMRANNIRPYNPGNKLRAMPLGAARFFLAVLV